MDIFSEFLKEFNIKNDIFKSNNNLVTFSLSEIKYEKKYQKNILKKYDVNFSEFEKVINDIDLSNNYENALFSLNTEVDYDNKINGGRIIFKIYNTMNNYKNNSIDLTILNKHIDEKFKQKISYIERNFYSLCFLIMLKNYFIKNKILNSNNIFDYINSIEGIIIQKDEKNIKLVIYIDKDYNELHLQNFLILLKKILHIQEKVKLCYTSYNKSLKPFFY